MKKEHDIRYELSAKKLKITPQRVKVLEAIYEMDNHPTTENVIDYVRKSDPNISAGTVYNILEVLVKNDLIKKVKTEKDVMRYDGMTENHHHLYCKQCDYIEDYTNSELDKILKDYFEQNKIDNFIIDEIKLSISGNFVIHKNKNH
ncbi:MAG: transcriptional repressor [Massilibacteroides sp.]|nr:transcriptional repressor [Massilibacteroides sp.]MDD3063598.1 transcriptional repressor [Massilibacteroides sp.]MDD4114766.1 transcriptional repressor [Massilibacteroides sp.]MDD4659826.1 transcriptional repressor [Massilibacteroides sp.]